MSNCDTHQFFNQGRKRGGGIRFGEMERDALLAHGTSFLLQDRLMNCSDYSTAWVCRTCGSLISLGYEDLYLGSKVGYDNVDPAGHLGPNGEYCRVCRAEEEESVKGQMNGIKKIEPTEFSLARNAQVLERKGKMEVIAIPYVFRYAFIRFSLATIVLIKTYRYLCAELAAMGIRLTVYV